MKYNLLVFFLFGLSVNNHSAAQDWKKEQKNKSLKILLISDLNDSYGSVTYSTEVHDLVEQIDKIRPDIILCGGDMVAGQQAALSSEQLDAMWAGFDRTVLSPVTRLKIPFGFTVGNHDASPGFLNDRRAASAFWLTNREKTHLSFVDTTFFPYYFSYIKNNVFFISWDASSAVISPDLKAWVTEQLAQPVAKNARARIVLGHLPLFAIVAAKNKPGEVLNEADKTLSFLKSNKVDMYISGHQHAYFPATKEKVLLVHSGCLGGGPRQLLNHDQPATKSYAVITVPVNKRKFKASIIGYTAGQKEVIPVKSLPETITGFNGTVQRMAIN